MLDINWSPPPRDLRQFAAIWVPLFAALAGGVLIFRSGAWTAAGILWGVAAAIAALGLASPAAVRPIFIGAMAAAYPVGWVVSHVVLGITYYVFFSTVGCVMRLVRYDPLRRHANRRARTYWSERPRDRPAAAYFKQF